MMTRRISEDPSEVFRNYLSAVASRLSELNDRREESLRFTSEDCSARLYVETVDAFLTCAESEPVTAIICDAFPPGLKHFQHHRRPSVTRDWAGTQRSLDLTHGEKCLYWFLEHLDVFRSPIPLSGHLQDDLCSAFADAIESPDAVDHVVGFACGFRVSNRFESSDGWILRPPSELEIKTLRMSELAAEPWRTYCDMAVFEFEQIKGTDGYCESGFETRLYDLLNCLLVHPDLELSIPLVARYLDGPFETPRMRTYANSEVFHREAKEWMDFVSTNGEESIDDCDMPDDLRRLPFERFQTLAVDTSTFRSLELYSREAQSTLRRLRGAAHDTVRRTIEDCSRVGAQIGARRSFSTMGLLDKYLAPEYQSHIEPIWQQRVLLLELVYTLERLLGFSRGDSSQLIQKRAVSLAACWVGNEDVAQQLQSAWSMRNDLAHGGKLAQPDEEFLRVLRRIVAACLHEIILTLGCSKPTDRRSPWFEPLSIRIRDGSTGSLASHRARFSQVECEDGRVPRTTGFVVWQRNDWWTLR